MDSLVNLLPPVTNFDGHGFQCTVVDDAYRLSLPSVVTKMDYCCKRLSNRLHKHRRKNMFHNQLWPTKYIDIFLAAIIVEAVSDLQEASLSPNVQCVHGLLLEGVRERPRRT